MSYTGAAIISAGKACYTLAKKARVKSIQEKLRKLLKRLDTQLVHKQRTDTVHLICRNQEIIIERQKCNPLSKTQKRTHWATLTVNWRNQTYHLSSITLDDPHKTDLLTAEYATEFSKQFAHHPNPLNGKIKSLAHQLRHHFAALNIVVEE